MNDTYGDNIKIVVNPNEEIAKTSAMKTYVNVLDGGVGITSNGLACSTAAMATKDGKRYIITAGHCLNAPDNDTVLAYQYSGSSDLVGTDHYSGFYNGVGVDIGLITITDTSRYISNLIVKNSTTTYDDSFSSTGNPIAGATVCKSETTTNYTLNTINSTNVNVTMTEVGHTAVCNTVETTTNINTVTGTGAFISGGDSHYFRKCQVIVNSLTF